MKKVKKLMSMVLVLLLLASVLSACSQETAAPPAASTAASEAAPAGTAPDATAAGGAIGMENVKVGVVMNTSKEDGGWSQAHYQSFMQVKKDLGLTDDQMVIMEEIPDTGSDCENAIEMLIDDGCNMIFGTSSGLSAAIYACASRHPDVFFHQFEGNTLDNCAAYTIRDYEAIFMCGYAAAKMSTVDELGFMAAQPQSSVVRAINAWAAGAQYANPNATVKVVWANSWYDPTVEKEGANSMLDSGIQSLGYHGSTTSVMQAAAEHDGYATGFHIDMKDYAPTAVLTSFMWNWAPIYSEFIQNVADGKWTNATLFKGMESGCASIAPFNADIMSDEIIADCEDVQKKVISGEVSVFAGPITDNKGNEVLADGAEFTDEEWIGMMYLAENVIGDLP